MATPRVLLVEGPDDKHVIRHICERLEIEQNFAIIDKGGFTRLRDALSVEAKVSGRVVLGILVDANEDVGARWNEVAARVRAVGVPVPHAPTPGGTVTESQQGLRVGIWLMPDNRESGELEDFAQRLIPGDDPVWPLARNYVAKIPGSDRKFKPGKLSRAEVHAWLATRKEPRLMGAAIGTGDLDVGVPLARSVGDWLQRLFLE